MSSVLCRVHNSPPFLRGWDRFIKFINLMLFMSTIYPSLVNAFNLGASVGDLARQTDLGEPHIIVNLVYAMRRGHIRPERAPSLAEEYVETSYRLLPVDPSAVMQLYDQVNAGEDFLLLLLDTVCGRPEYPPAVDAQPVAQM
jgi:hypothetical protein